MTAKILVVLTLAAAYYVALVPMMLVYTYHVGVPLLLQRFLIWAPGLLFASIAIGTLIGVLFIGHSIAAPAATGMGVLLAYAGFVPLQELMVAQGNGATRTGHLTLASPAVLLKNALGFTLVAASIPSNQRGRGSAWDRGRRRACARRVGVSARAGRGNVGGKRAQRWIITLAIAAIVLVPVSFADTNYDTPAPPRTNAPAIQGLFARLAAASH